MVLLARWRDKLAGGPHALVGTQFYDMLGPAAVLRHTLVGTEFYDMPCSGRCFTTCLVRYGVLRHALVMDVVLRHALVMDVVLRHALVMDVVLRHALVRDVVLHALVRDVVLHALVRDVVLQHALLRTHFYNIPGSRGAQRI